MARSIKCSRCKKDKEPGREGQPYCQTCRTEYRRSKGIKPKVYSDGGKRTPPKNPNCIDCGKVKDNPTQTYCNACRAIRNKRWTLETGRVKKHQSGLCPCGAERAPNQRYFCSSCKAKDSKEWRSIRRTPEEVLLKAKAYKSAMATWKRAVRKVTEEYIRRGILQKGPCEVCGTTEMIEAHHDDYNKPMEIRSLCRQHHLEYHVKNRRKGKAT